MITYHGKVYEFPERQGVIDILDVTLATLPKAVLLLLLAGAARGTFKISDNTLAYLSSKMGKYLDRTQLNQDGQRVFRHDPELLAKLRSLNPGKESPKLENRIDEISKNPHDNGKLSDKDHRVFANDSEVLAPEAAPVTSPKTTLQTVSEVPCAPPDLGTLLRLIHKFLLRFMAFSAPEHAIAITLWIAHTWVYDVFGYTPYLFIYSPTRRCGKSRIFECLNGLARQAWTCAGITGPTLFRKIEADGPTILIDEIDTIFPSGRAKNNESLRCVLNAGFSRGITISRCSGSGLKEYNVFCPKAFAGIGDSLPDTVKDRSIRIPLSRRAKHQNVEKFRCHDVEEPIKLIVDGLSIWAANEEVLETLRAARPAIPDELGDRAADISEPLLAIADMAG
ncbi:MAG: DUF3631 domain-containing protein, partial [Deltaproteobacteria bacterium]